MTSRSGLTDHYIRDRGLARLHAAEQETISAAIVRPRVANWIDLDSDRGAPLG
jgi:hypothetical protein